MGQGEWAPVNVRNLLEARVRNVWDTSRRTVALLRTKDSIKPLKDALRAGLQPSARAEVDPGHAHARLDATPPTLTRDGAGRAYVHMPHGQVWAKVLCIRDIPGTRGPRGGWVGRKR